MSDTAVNKVIQYGTQAERIAFTPNPAVGSQILYLWYETDNPPDLYAWDSSSWVQVNPAGSGGDVVGPASATDNAFARFDGTTGKIIQNSVILASDTGAITFPSGITQIFAPTTDYAGINVGQTTADPANPQNGDVYYDSANNLLRAYINGAWVSLGAGGASSNYRLSFTIDGGGSAVSSTGLQKYLSIPVTGTINRVRVLADQPGDIIYDLWNDSWANRPPTVVDSITAAAKPTLSSAQFYEDTTLTGWSTGVTIGDLMAVAIDSVGTLTWAVIEIFITPS